MVNKLPEEHVKILFFWRNMFSLCKFIFEAVKATNLLQHLAFVLSSFAVDSFWSWFFYKLQSPYLLDHCFPAASPILSEFHAQRSWVDGVLSKENFGIIHFPSDRIDEYHRMVLIKWMKMWVVETTWRLWMLQLRRKSSNWRQAKRGSDSRTSPGNLCVRENLRSRHNASNLLRKGLCTSGSTTLKTGWTIGFSPNDPRSAQVNVFGDDDGDTISTTHFNVRPSSGTLSSRIDDYCSNDDDHQWNWMNNWIVRFEEVRSLTRYSQ